MAFRKIVLRVGIVTMLGLVLVAPVVRQAAAATTNYAFTPNKDVIITELQTSSLSSSGEEFIELFNNTAADIDLADTANGGKDAWKLQYFSKAKLTTLLPAASNASSWTSPFRTISLTGVVPAGDYYVIAAQGYTPGNLDPDQIYTSTLADDGGALQLVDGVTSGTATTYGVHDRLAWSNDKTLPTSPLLYSAPGAGASLQRLPNEDDEYLNQDGTLTGFAVSNAISPKNAWQPPVVEETPPVTEEPSSGTGDVPAGDPVESPAVPATNDGLQPVRITELLANPASPHTDEVDEYIELYNPNDAAFNLNGYTLETGTTTLHDFTFTSDVVLQPGEYRAFYSFETKLPLSNSGGQVRLLDKTQAAIAQSDPYTTADDGMSWSLDPTDDTWKWTSSLTPGAINIIIVPAVVQKTAKAATVTKAKATTTAKKTIIKVKGASTTKTKKATAKPKKAKVTTAAAASTTLARPGAPIHIAAIAAVAALGVAYMLYEYRHDLGNRFHQFRTNRILRGKLGK